MLLILTHRRKRHKNVPDLCQERSQEDLSYPRDFLPFYSFKSNSTFLSPSPFKMQFGYLSILCVVMSFVAATPLPGNGVNAPGAIVLDGTPRDCIVNACGAQADTGIIRD
ncbi:hypothetical protein BKA57DRAFT_512929 [Linnemannia elongata]|nr:hypothetical protein BKA57DRAFT_512929 [Linnemannia elongata]